VSTCVTTMSKPTRNWLLDPIFPAPPSLPHLDLETRAFASFGDPEDTSSSGTWAVGARVDQAQDEDEDEPRFAKSDTEAPTVRPGSLHAAKAG
jgi:hypothetical protein